MDNLLDDFWKNYFRPHNESVLSLAVQRKIANLKSKYILEGNLKGLKILERFVKNQINSKRLTQSSVSIPDSMSMPPSGFDVGKLMAYGKAPTSGGVSYGKAFREHSRFSELMSVPDYIQRKYHGHSMTEIYRKQSKFQRMMNEPIGGSITIGDDDQYAFGADTGANRGGDFAYLAEQEKEQRERRASMRRAEARGSVRQKRERLNYMKEYPNFFKNSKMTAKEVKNIAKMIKRWEKAPIFGQILKVAGKSPLGVEGTVILAALTGLNWFAQNADRANKNMVQWKNMQNLSGKASDAFTAAAYYAGIDKPGEISKRFGIATLKYGDAEKFYRIMGANMANLPPIARMAIAKKLGWDETDVAIADIFSGRIGFDETRDMNVTRNMVSVGTTLGFATGSGFWNTLNAALSTPFQSVGSRTINSMDQFRFLQERSKEMIDSERDANNAAESADKFKSNGYNLDDKQSSTRALNITINTGDLSLPNVQNANDFLMALSNEGIRRAQRAEILTTFDTMKV